MTRHLSDGIGSTGAYLVGESEVRRNDDGSPDEVVAWGYVHLEQMDADSWLLLVDTADGHLIRVSLTTKRGAAIHALVERDGVSDYATGLMPAVRRALDRGTRRLKANRLRRPARRRRDG